MKHTRLLAPAAALLLGACADNRSSIEIAGRAAPGDTTSCTFTAGGKNILGPGTLDVSFPFLTYSTVLYVTNNLADPSSTIPDALPASKAWRATAARTRVNPQDYMDRFGASPALLPFTGENTLALDGQTTPVGGASAQFVDVISQTLGAQIAAAAIGTGQTRRAIFGITLEGMTLDGARVDSGEFFLPVDICNGCLQPQVACTATQVPVRTNCFGLGQDTVAVCQ